MSGWQQLKRIYQTFMQHDYKNASEHNTEDFLYWFKLRAINLKDLPSKIFSVSKNLFSKIVDFINKWAREILDDWYDKTKEWDEEERKINEQGLPKLKWEVRLKRAFVRLAVNFFRKTNTFLKWIFGNDKDNDNEQKKVNLKRS